MKKRKISSTLVVVVVLLFLTWYTYPWVFSAGGIGSIKIYQFDLSRKALSEKFDSLILNDGNIDIPSKTIYNLDGTGYEEDSKYIYFISNKNDTLVYGYDYFNQNINNAKCSLALTSFGKYGESPLKKRRDIFFFQRSIRASGFEEVLNRLQIPYIVEK